MKAISTTLFAIFMLSLGTQAQLAQLIDHDGNVVNGQTVVHWGDAQTANQKVGLDVVLQGAGQKVVNVRRYELSVQPGTENYFCWGVCYTPVDAGTQPFWQAQSQHSIVLDAGVPEDAFGGYHSPNGILGSSTYRYVWFDVNDQTDSVWVDIQFEITAVGIEERNGVEEFTVFPNPAVGREVSVSYAFQGQASGLSLVVHDALGQPVLERPLTSASGRVQVETGELSPGVYFTTLQRNGLLLSTQRLVIGQ